MNWRLWLALRLKRSKILNARVLVTLRSILANFKTLAFEKREFKILVDLKILAFHNPEFKIFADFKIFSF